MSIERYLDAIHRSEKRRDDVRAQLVTEDLPDTVKGSLDAELFSLTVEIERNARMINEALREMHKHGTGGGRAIKVPDVSDPDLKAFLTQVKATVDRLNDSKAEKGQVSPEERSKLAREKEKAGRLKDESVKTRKDLESEQKKVADARKQVEKDIARLEKDRKKLGEEKTHIETDKERAEKDRDTIEDKLEKDKKERDAADRERKDIGKRLKGLRDAKRRAQMENRARELGAKIQQLDRATFTNRRALDDRINRILKSIDRELGKVRENDDQFKKEHAHLEDEAEALEERAKQLEKALACTEERIETIEQAEEQLKSAV